MTDIYTTYADLTAQICALTEQKQALQKRLIGYVGKQGGLVRKPFGTFSVVEFPKYLYSQDTQEIEAKLADLKKKEREMGIAEITSTTTSLRYQSR